PSSYPPHRVKYSQPEPEPEPGPRPRPPGPSGPSLFIRLLSLLSTTPPFAQSSPFPSASQHKHVPSLGHSGLFNPVQPRPSQLLSPPSPLPASLRLLGLGRLLAKTANYLADWTADRLSGLLRRHSRLLPARSAQESGLDSAVSLVSSEANSCAFHASSSSVLYVPQAQAFCAQPAVPLSGTFGIIAPIGLLVVCLAVRLAVDLATVRHQLDANLRPTLSPEEPPKTVCSSPDWARQGYGGLARGSGDEESDH
ncbi:unnamed protein product, partial [Protopolystoma xenopodis]